MISKRIQNMTPSATMVQSAKIAELKQQGIEIIGFNVGEPDYNTPMNIIKKGEEAYHLGLTRYTPSAGMIELRQAICEKFEKEYQLKYSPKEVVVSSGAKQSLTNALMAIIDPGDEVIIPTPCWVSYVEMVKLADGVPVLVALDEEAGFDMDVEKVREAVTSKTKAMIINSPNNPTGAVYSEEQLRKLGELAVEKDFIVISDEMYEKLVYDGKKNVCFAALSPEIKEKTITVNGVSKAYAMTGWRIGYALGPIEIIKAMSDYQGNTTSNANTPAQYASIEAISNSEDSVEAMRLEFDKRRQFMFDRLNQMEGITCSRPTGAFYMMPNVKSFYGKSYNGFQVNNSLDMANYLVEEAKIAVVTGAAFEAPDNIRISYSNSMENIQEGLNRMEEALKKLQ